MKIAHLLVIVLFLLFLTAAVCFSGANNNTPHDAFESYQSALRHEDVNLLLEVFYIKNAGSMSQSRLRQELKTLKGYDGYKNYTIAQVLENGDSAKVKVKGTLGYRENVKRTFQMKRFNTGWKITRAWNY